MEWKKSNMSQNELEKQQQAYIKEALEMAKRSMASQLDKTAEAERIKKEAAEKAAREKAAAERAAQEKAATERDAQEKAAAEKAAQEKAAAERAVQERAAAEKAAQEKTVAERAAQERAAAEKAAQEKAEEKNIHDDLPKYHELKENVNIEITKDYEEAVESHDIDAITPDKDNAEDCGNTSEEDIIDISQIKNSSDGHQKNISQDKMPVRSQNSNPPNFNRYINEHNKNQCNCPHCQRKRAEQR